METGCSHVARPLRTATAHPCPGPDGRATVCLDAWVDVMSLALELEDLLGEPTFGTRAAGP